MNGVTRAYNKGRAILLRTVVVTVVVMCAPLTNAESDCGNPFQNHYGPFDYRLEENKREYAVVERLHFNALTERAALTGKTNYEAESGSRTADDLDYTLRAVPNHARALYAMAMYELFQARLPPEQRYPGPMDAECFFERAALFAPDDVTVHTLHGIFRHRKGDLEGTLEAFQKAVEIRPNDSRTQYNLGLIYFDLNKYDKARTHAKKAYALGYQATELRERLIGAGEWPGD